MARHLRRPCATDPAHGCPPARRDAAEHVRWGVVLLDKPAGVTSRQAADCVREALGAAKAGHGGTLDPGVTGVLPVLLGKCTRAAGALLGCDKAYEGLMVLHGDVPDGELEAALAQFRGTVEQTPPRRSRVKRRPRLRTVHEFTVMARQGRRAEFAVRCQGGTYVRTLIHDLGQALGCGAHMARLRRTGAGPCLLGECVSMEQIVQAGRAMQEGAEEAVRRVVHPVEEVLARLLPAVVVDDGAVSPVCHGARLAVPGVCELDDFGPGGRVAVLTLKGELIGIGTALMAAEQVLTESQGEAVAVDTVLMDAETYPRRGQAQAAGAPGGPFS